METCNIWSKEVLMQMKKVIIRTKNKNKPIRVILETLIEAKCKIY